MRHLINRPTLTTSNAGELEKQNQIKRHKDNVAELAEDQFQSVKNGILYKEE